MANAAATGAETISPARTLTPGATPGSWARPSRPRSASALTYGSVAFVTARVDVRGTAPGRLAAQ
jgi:hypothetical protein